MDGYRVFQWSLNYSQRCDGNVFLIDDVFLQPQLNKSQFSVRRCLQIKKNCNFQPYKMIWRRKHLTPATFLIIVFTGPTLTCHPAEYQTGNKCCPMCAAGNRVKTDCTEFRSTSCLPCLDGTFMDKPTGRKNCFDCTNCDKGNLVKTDCTEFRSTSCLPCLDGTYMDKLNGQKNCFNCTNCDEVGGLKLKTSCTTRSDAVCEPLDGFFCTDSVGNNCVEAQKHRICDPGQYINQRGTAFTDTVCFNCSAGTFSDGTFTSCQPHTQCESINLQLIKPGTASTDAECGENSPNVTVPVTICVLLFLLIAAGLVSLFYFRKKKKSLRPEKNTSPDILSQASLENGSESSESVLMMMPPG